MSSQMTLRRKWTFRLLAMALGLLPLALVEVGLRWIDGPGNSLPSDGFDGTRLFTPVRTDGQVRTGEPFRTGGKDVAIELARTVTWEISPQRSNYFCHASFVAPKPKGVRRIFVLGGSTVQGRPYATETSFAKFLELRLNHSTTDWRHEVINCGGVSYASDRVERILHEVLRHQPDALVLYIGHNEFLEDRQRDSNSSPAQRWINRIAGRSRAVGALRKVWAGTGSDQKTNNQDETLFELQTRLDRDGGMELYRRDPRWRGEITRRFQEALDRMVQTCRRNGVPLILCVPSSDVVRTPPFKVLPDPSASPSESGIAEAAWRTIINADIDPAERLRLARHLVQIDTQHAGAHYILGRFAYDRDPTPETCSDITRAHLIAARDCDVCPLRATTGIEEIVRRVRSETSPNPPVLVVDVPRLFDRPPLMRSSAEDGVADPGWFADHVHPTINGHRRIARDLSAKFESWGWIESSAQDEERYQDAAREHLGSLGEEYFQRGKQRLAGLRQWASGRSGQPPSQSTSLKSRSSAVEAVSDFKD